MKNELKKGGAELLVIALLAALVIALAVPAFDEITAEEGSRASTIAK